MNTNLAVRKFTDTCNSGSLKSINKILNNKEIMNEINNSSYLYVLSNLSQYVKEEKVFELLLNIPNFQLNSYELNKILINAMINRNKKIVYFLLKNNKINIDEDDGQPIRIAMLIGDTELFDFLLTSKTMKKNANIEDCFKNFDNEPKGRFFNNFKSLFHTAYKEIKEKNIKMITHIVINYDSSSLDEYKDLLYSIPSVKKIIESKKLKGDLDNNLIINNVILKKSKI